MPFLSICIPAYQRLHYLRRLLHSISEQTFRDYEIIVSDDTPGNEVELLCREYTALPIRYFKNETALGTPENWNAAICKATGQWIKIMHDDDWFVAPDSLETFATTARANPDGFIFSAYYFVHEKENRTKRVEVSKTDLHRLQKDPFYLYRTNYIGNPSCTLYRKEAAIAFDRRFKWVVDFEFYIRYLTTTKAPAVYIDRPLINVGVNDTQVTTYTFRVPDVEIPENHQMLAGQGFTHLKNVFIYDYFWRLYRNLSIRRVNQIKAYGYLDPLPPVLQKMIRFQNNIPIGLLKTGALSKSLMLFHYLMNYRSIRHL